jgi:hypothetical protein
VTGPGRIAFALATAIAALTFTSPARAQRRRADADHVVSRDKSAPEPQGGTRAGDLFAVRVAVEAGSRSFAYSDRVTPTLRSYTLVAAPLGLVDAELYPLARTRLAGLKDFGVTFDYAQAFALSSDDSTGTPVNTAWSLFDVGARERIHVGRAWLLGLHAGYGQMTYSFDGSLGTPAILPGVQYQVVRGGADARVALGRFSIYAYGSYLDVLATGPIGGYFARESVAGLEGRLGLARDLGRGFEVSLEVAYTRYFYAFNPEPGDPYVAGGASDQMAFGSLGLAYVL